MPYFPYQGKQIFYSESGTGRPLVMLHGNTASSVLFEFLLPLYQRDFRVIRMDFLGNGRSNRVETFPEDLWIEQAGQVLALIEHLKIEKADLLGTSLGRRQRGAKTPGPGAQGRGRQLRRQDPARLFCR